MTTPSIAPLNRNPGVRFEQDAISCEEVIAYSHSGRVWAVAVSPDGRTVASASHDNTARVFHVHAGDGEEELDIENNAHNDTVYDVSLGGRCVATAGRDGVVYVRKLSQPSHPVLLKGVDDGRAWAGAAKLSRDGKKLVASISNKVFVTDVATGKDLHTLKTDYFVARVAVNKDEKLVFLLLKNEMNGNKNFVHVWDIAKGSVTRYTWLCVADSEHYPGISANGAGDVLAIADSNALRLWQVGKNEMTALHGYSAPDGHCDCALTPDGARLVACKGQAGFGVWDCERKTQLFSTSAFSVTACAISDDGATVVFGCEYFSVRVWSLRPSYENSRRRKINLEAMAREKFQKALVVGEECLSVGEASIHLNVFLKKVARLKTVSEDKMVRVFDAVANKDELKISEDVFVKMFQNIHEEQSMAPFLKEHVAVFRDCAKPSNALHVKIAARLICKFRKEMRKHRKLPPLEADGGDVEAELRTFACGENGKIEEKAFIAALKKLVYEF